MKYIVLIVKTHILRKKNPENLLVLQSYHVIYRQYNKELHGVFCVVRTDLSAITKKINQESVQNNNHTTKTMEKFNDLKSEYESTYRIYILKLADNFKSLK